MGQIVDFAHSQIGSHLKPNLKALDLCCGNGWFTLELARMGFFVTAVDISKHSIEVALKMLVDADLSLNHGVV